MAGNPFWNFVTTFVSGTLAKAEDVNTNFSGINTGFDAVDTEINKAIQVTNSPGVVDIAENAASRANKLIQFNASGGIELGTVIGSYKGNHADASGTSYYVRDVVKDAAGRIGLNNVYICNTAHTSTGTIAVDSANFDLLIDVADVEASKVAAALSETNAAASADFLDDRILGAFTTAAEPATDNDGNALLTGAQYFNTSLNRMKIWNGTAWQLTTANAVDVVYVATGDIIATDVQAAITELDSEKTAKTTTITPNAPLAGGGDLSANRTLSISAATTSAAGSMSAADKTTIDNLSSTYLNKTADDTTAGDLIFNKAAPVTWFEDTSAAVDEGKFSIGVSGGFSIDAWNDAYSITNKIISASKTGGSLDSITLGSSLSTSVKSSGDLVATGRLIVRGPVPTTSTSAGTSGSIAVDANYLYVCVGVDLWKRMALDLTSW